MSNFERFQSGQITQEHWQEFQRKLQEYYSLRLQEKNVKKEIIGTKLKGMADLQNAMSLNEKGVKQLEQLTKLKSELSTVLEIEKEFDHVQNMAKLLQEDFELTFSKKK